MNEVDELMNEVENNELPNFDIAMKVYLKMAGPYLWGLDPDKGNIPPHIVIYDEKFYVLKEVMYLTNEEMKNFNIEDAISNGNYSLLFEGEIPEELQTEVKYWGNKRD